MLFIGHTSSLRACGLKRLYTRPKRGRATKTRDHKAIAAEAAEVQEYYRTLEMMDVWREREASRWNAAQDEAIKEASDEWVKHVYRPRFSDYNREVWYKVVNLEPYHFEHGELIF